MGHKLVAGPCWLLPREIGLLQPHMSDSITVVGAPRLPPLTQLAQPVFGITDDGGLETGSYGCASLPLRHIP